jgi:hypothetical protein
MGPPQRVVRWMARGHSETIGLVQALHNPEMMTYLMVSPPYPYSRDQSLRYAFSATGERKFAEGIEHIESEFGIARPARGTRTPEQVIQDWARDNLATGYEPIRTETTVKPVWHDDMQVAYQPE